MCRHPIPHLPDLEACTQDFRSINNDWKCRIAKYGQYATALFFRRCNQTATYYLLTIHPNLFAQASKGIKDNERLPDPLHCHWAAVLFKNPLHTQMLKSMFREQRLLPPSHRVEASPLRKGIMLRFTPIFFAFTYISYALAYTTYTICSSDNDPDDV